VTAEARIPGTFLPTLTERIDAMADSQQRGLRLISFLPLVIVLMGVLMS
jgi:hypothetical protein